MMDLLFLLFALSMVFILWGIHHKRLSVGMSVYINGNTFFGVKEMNLKANQKFTLTMVPKDAIGAAVVIPAGASTSFVTSDDTMVSVVTQPDMTGLVVAHNPGNATITGMLTLADGTQFTATIDLVIEAVVVVPPASVIVSVDMVASDPVDQ